MRCIRTLIITSALSALALVAAPVALAATTTPAAGTCTHPTHPAMAPVKYRYASRANVWRAHPTFEHVTPTSLPGAGKNLGTIGAVTIHTGQSAWYLILDARQVGDNCYVLLRLPAVKYQNFRRGWINRDVLSIERVRYQVEIDLSARGVQLYRGAKRVLSAKAVIGKAATPTPKSGRATPFAFYDTKRAKASGFTGSWELATTADSPADETLGRIGLHGRGGASLTDPLGQALSHGCVRVNNAVVNKIVATVGIAKLTGVPVLIVA
jgi:hypothetical protein